MSSDSSSGDELVEIGDEKKIQPKAIVPVNNVQGLNNKLKEVKLDLEWLERLDITVALSDPSDNQTGVDKDAESKAEHDFKRELSFINQAKIAANEALERLKKLNVPVKRPDDYFAEMAKSDAHMTKVREKLLTKEMAIERSEKAKALRLQRKHGKKIQQEVLQKKQSEKKKMLEALKKSKKGKLDVSTILDEKKNMNKPMQKNRSSSKKHKEQYKNEKYGYGGRKKRSKYNTADSAAYYPGMESNSSRGMKRGKGRQKPRGGRRRR